MRSGFFEYDDPCGALEDPDAVFEMFGDTSGLLVEPVDYIHGFCDVFAYWLSLKFGYDIVARVVDCPGRQRPLLVHATCQSDFGGKSHWVDVRGIADDYDDVFDCFSKEEDALVLSCDGEVEDLLFEGTDIGRERFKDVVAVCESKDLDLALEEIENMLYERGYGIYEFS